MENGAELLGGTPFWKEGSATQDQAAELLKFGIVTPPVVKPPAGLNTAFDGG
jgi:hypothetical protein